MPRMGIFCLVTGLLGGVSLSMRAAEPWRELEGKGFVILSDAPLREVEGFALAYSAFYQAFDSLFVSENRNLPRSTLLLFGSNKDFRNHLAKEAKSGMETIGYSIEVDGTPISTFSIGGGRQRALQIAFEAEGIWAIRRLGYFMPIWMTQGAGQVLSTVEVAKNRYTLGEDTRGFESLLRQSAWLQWNRFFDVHVGSKEYETGGDTSYHAQAWALMHWILLKDDQGPQRFKELAALLRTHTALEAVQKVMQEKPDRFQGAIEAHLRRAAKGRKIEFDEAAVRAGWKVHPASPTRVAMTRAELLAKSGRLVEADVLLTQMRLKEPDSAWIKEAFARRAMRDRNDNESVHLYREAIGMGSENPAAYLVSAKERLDRSQAGGLDYGGQGNRQYVEEALAEIRRALALDPGSVAAYQLMGRAFFVSPTVDPTMVDELRKGASSGDAGAQVRFYLGLLYQRLGREEAYLNELTALASSEETPAHLRREVVKRLQADPFMSAKLALQDLASEGKLDEGRRRIEPGSADSFKLNPAQRQRLQTWLAEQEAIAELKTLSEQKQWKLFRAKAEAFIQNHPQSSAVSSVRSYLDRLVRQLGSATEP